jgi:hypothetical protein
MKIIKADFDTPYDTDEPRFTLYLEVPDELSEKQVFEQIVKEREEKENDGEAYDDGMLDDTLNRMGIRSLKYDDCWKLEW